MSTCYGDLTAWQKAMDLVVEVYRYSRSFPTEERYGLTSQIRRSAVSVPSNIAEGRGRFHPKEFIQFLFHARGSLMELETQLEIAGRLGYLNESDYKHLSAQTTEVARILNGLLNHAQDAIPH